ncbi:MAG: hypothetical protein ACK40Z_00180 [Dietzia sp.]
MDLSTIIANIASGSAQATPATGSAAVDLFTSVPSDLINYFAGLVQGLGS